MKIMYKTGNQLKMLIMQMTKVLYINDQIHKLHQRWTADLGSVFLDRIRLGKTSPRSAFLL